MPHPSRVDMEVIHSKPRLPGPAYEHRKDQTIKINTISTMDELKSTSIQEFDLKTPKNLKNKAKNMNRLGFDFKNTSDKSKKKMDSYILSMTEIHEEPSNSKSSSGENLLTPALLQGEVETVMLRKSPIHREGEEEK